MKNLTSSLIRTAAIAAIAAGNIVAAPGALNIMRQRLADPKESQARAIASRKAELAKKPATK